MSPHWGASTESCDFAVIVVIRMVELIRKTRIDKMQGCGKMKKNKFFETLHELEDREASRTPALESLASGRQRRLDVGPGGRKPLFYILGGLTAGLLFSNFIAFLWVELMAPEPQRWLAEAVDVSTPAETVVGKSARPGAATVAREAAMRLALPHHGPAAAQAGQNEPAGHAEAAVAANQPAAAGLYPEVGTRPLTQTEIEGKTPAELRIMRNEVFARHSYAFRTSAMHDYFAGQTWYPPRYDDVSTLLTRIEVANLELIRKYEATVAAQETAARPFDSDGPPVAAARISPSPAAVGLYPETTSRRLTLADLEGKTPWELRVMRNEIFARHSYAFKTKKMKGFFGRQDWYPPLYRDVSSVLSGIEVANIDLIRKQENRQPQ